MKNNVFVALLLSAGLWAVTAQPVAGQDQIGSITITPGEITGPTTLALITGGYDGNDFLLSLVNRLNTQY